MGLDQYAFSRKQRPDKEIDFEGEDADVELFYWRKHPNLQGWMEALYRTKGGAVQYFNCVNVLLTSEDLDRLEASLDNLPETTGFFFGQSCAEDKVRDLEFISIARAAIADGQSVYYSSWW